MLEKLEAIEYVVKSDCKRNLKYPIIEMIVYTTGYFTEEYLNKLMQIGE